VEGFAEKPSPEQANSFTRSWRYLWNTGYCVGSAQTKLALLARSHELFSADHQVVLQNFFALPRANFFQLISQHPQHLRVVPADFGWSDVGDWSSLASVMTAAGETATMVRRGPVADLSCENSLVLADKRLVVAIGLKHIAVIDTEDALLVIDKSHAQEIKTVLDQLENSPYRHLL
jgi:mannose-1-phosphate guanylyltransferase